MSIADMLADVNKRHMEGKHYVLMNKDAEICEFIIRGEGDLEECVSVRGTSKLPLYFGSINSWVSRRNAAKHRKHVESILDSWGANTKSGFISLTHCLSVNDTFWVQSVDENLKWANVNLYDNEFSDVVSKLSFDGVGLMGEKFSTSSPEFTTDGFFNKCWVRRNNGIYLYKAGTEKYRNAGREPYSEVIASQIFKELLGHDAVSYTLRKFHGKTVSECALFTDKGSAYLPYSTLNYNSCDLWDILRVYEEYDCGDMVRGMFIGDGVSLNSDRHLSNFGWLCHPDNMKPYRMAPIFDFNMSMVVYADEEEGFSDLDAYINEHAPKTGVGYVESAKALLTPAFRAKLINMKDLVLTVQCDDVFTEERLRKMNIIKNVMIDRILGREAEFRF